MRRCERCMVQMLNRNAMRPSYETSTHEDLWTGPWRSWKIFQYDPTGGKPPGTQYTRERTRAGGMKQEYEAESQNLQAQLDEKRATSADYDNKMSYAQQRAGVIRPSSWADCRASEIRAERIAARKNETSGRKLKATKTQTETKKTKDAKRDRKHNGMKRTWKRTYNTIRDDEHESKAKMKDHWEDDFRGWMKMNNGEMMMRSGILVQRTVERNCDNNTDASGKRSTKTFWLWIILTVAVSLFRFEQLGSVALLHGLKSLRMEREQPYNRLNYSGFVLSIL